MCNTCFYNVPCCMNFFLWLLFIFELSPANSYFYLIFIMWWLWPFLCSDNKCYFTLSHSSLSLSFIPPSLSPLSLLPSLLSSLSPLPHLGFHPAAGVDPWPPGPRWPVWGGRPLCEYLSLVLETRISQGFALLQEKLKLVLEFRWGSEWQVVELSWGSE